MRLPCTFEVFIMNKRITVLAIDDDIMVCNFMKKGLTKFGHTVFTAIDGIDGIEMFKRMHETISCIILDLSMPLLDGRECIKRIKEINDSVPVIFSTGQDINEISEDLISLGAYAIIQKPVNFANVENCIREAIDNNICSKKVLKNLI
jgi:DNA-binding response OmpR family regulator